MLLNLIRKICVIVAAVCSLALPVQAGDFVLGYLGQQIVPSGIIFDGTVVGGLSSLDYNANSGRYFAISDDRSSISPARFYELSLDLAKFQRSSKPGYAGVNFDAVTTIRQPGGGTFARNTVDPEGLRFDRSRSRIYWSDEGRRSRAGYRNPVVREMNLDGSHVRDFAVPDYYHPSGSTHGFRSGDRGIHDNLAFESLTISKDGSTLYTATENGLAQDSPPAAVGNGSRTRILSFNIATGLPGAEYVYEVEPVAVAPIVPGLYATNGLTDMLAVGDRQFLAIERSYALGAQTPGSPVTGKTIRLFYVDARNATDISGLESIVGQNIKAVTKTLLLDLSELKQDDGSILALDNIEGITLGPEFEGKATLILVSDNNFSSRQFTQFIALQITPAPSD